MELKSSGLFFVVLVCSFNLHRAQSLDQEERFVDSGSEYEPSDVSSGNHSVGRIQECTNEGQPYEVNHIDRGKCYSCKCKHGFVECQHSCPSVEGCYFVEVKDNNCCSTCKGCMYKGVYHSSYTEWVDPEDPCKVLRCQASLITETRMKCHTPCSNSLAPRKGQCCRTCPECKLHGHVPSNNREIMSADPCLKCTCGPGGMTCSKIACQVLNCLPDKIKYIEGECCPKCVGNNTRYGVSNHCVFTNRLIKEGSYFNYDKCTRCVCRNETSICHRETCPVLQCSLKHQRLVGNGCCKECDESPPELKQQCSYNGHDYEEGETKQIDPCIECKCSKGIIICSKTRCNDSSCPSGSTPVIKEGECCPTCVETSATCTVFGDLHYKTFDGLMYNSRGVGKYQMVADCSKHTFSVRVANVYRTKSRTSSSTKRITIKAAGSRINLGQKLITKVNGKPILFPYFNNNIEIQKIDTNMLQIHLPNGVEITWNGRSFLEVMVPPKFKKKLCGLCGNFNLNTRDDFKMRNGTVVNEANVMKFINSWCVGKNCWKKVAHAKPCGRPRNRSIKKNCDYINDLFGLCPFSKKYHKACMMDMCDCPSGKCYCESLMAYAQQCKRARVNIGDWQSKSMCMANRIKNEHNGKSRGTSLRVEQLWQQINSSIRINKLNPSRSPPPTLPIS